MKRRIRKVVASILCLTLALVTVLSLSGGADTVSAAVASSDFEAELAQFPESYKPALRALHAKHPSWHFQAVRTNTNWSDAVYEEYKFGDMLPSNWSGTRAVSIIEVTAGEAWKSKDSGAYDATTNTWTTGWDGDSWTIASKEAVAYYMDPRNFLSEEGIFQFYSFDNTGNTSSQLLANAATAIGATYLAGSVTDTDGTVRSYPEMIQSAGDQTGMNPLMLLCTIVLENGQEGYKKNQISGNAPGYEGLFNYYNIGAYVDGTFSTAWSRGLWIAAGGSKSSTTWCRPWNTRWKAILGGATYFAQKFKNVGQNSYYLKRFNVLSTSSSIYSNQFSTDVGGAYKEGKLVYKCLNKAGLMDLGQTFTIPVYENMPSSASPVPGTDSGNVVDTIEDTGDSGNSADSGNSGSSTQVEDTGVYSFEYVSALYSGCLGREGSTEELVNWSNAISSGSMTAAQAAYRFVFSDECTARRLGNQEYMKMLYKSIFGRDADSTGLASWTASLDSGMGRVEAFAGFVSSEEFENRCGTLRITKGSFDINHWNFIEDAYANVLGRTPALNEVAAWLWQMDIGLTATELVHTFVNSEEGMTKTGGTDAEYISVLYRMLLNREAGEEEINAWAALITSGQTRDAIFQGIANSDEFGKKCANYGVTQGQWLSSDIRDMHPQITAFVARLYNVCLGRQFDEDGLKNWVVALATGTCSGADIAVGFFMGEEFKNADYSEVEFITKIYKVMLDREPDASGLVDWMARSVVYGREDVVRGVAGSVEYGQLCAACGIRAV